MPAHSPLLLKDPKALRALASPVSQELIDTLEAAGQPLTVAELATQLGKHADGLYYHLRRLLKAGLVVELADAAAASRFRTAAPTGARLQLLYPRSAAGCEPVSRVVKSLLRTAQRDFERSLRSGSAVVTGVKRDLWAGRVKGWVSSRDLVEINHLIERLRELLHQPRSRERHRLIAAAWVLAPVAGQSGRRTSGSAKS